MAAAWGKFCESWPITDHSLFCCPHNNLGNGFFKSCTKQGLRKSKLKRAYPWMSYSYSWCCLRQYGTCKKKSSYELSLWYTWNGFLLATVLPSKYPMWINSIFPRQYQSQKDFIGMITYYVILFSLCSLYPPVTLVYPGSFQTNNTGKTPVESFSTLSFMCFCSNILFPFLPTVRGIAQMETTALTNPWCYGPDVWRVAIWSGLKSL